MLSKIFFLALLATVKGSVPCTPSSIESYTTTDASVLTSIAYVTSFKLTCNTPYNGNYHAVVDDVIYQVAGAGTDKFQVSFVKEVKDQTRGEHVIKIYSDEEINLYKNRKVPKTVTATITINHPGAYNGPLLSSEHLAAVLGVCVAWFAIAQKSRLLN